MWWAKKIVFQDEIFFTFCSVLRWRILGIHKKKTQKNINYLLCLSLSLSPPLSLCHSLNISSTNIYTYTNPLFTRSKLLFLSLSLPLYLSFFLFLHQCIGVQTKSLLYFIQVSYKILTEYSSIPSSLSFFLSFFLYFFIFAWIVFVSFFRVVFDCLRDCSIYF